MYKLFHLAAIHRNLQIRSPTHTSTLNPFLSHKTYNIKTPTTPPRNVLPRHKSHLHRTHARIHRPGNLRLPGRRLPLLRRLLRGVEPPRRSLAAAVFLHHVKRNGYLERDYASPRRGRRSAGGERGVGGRGTVERWEGVGRKWEGGGRRERDDGGVRGVSFPSVPPLCTHLRMTISYIHPSIHPPTHPRISKPTQLTHPAQATPPDPQATSAPTAPTSQRTSS